jgi:hypothetical protein
MRLIIGYTGRVGCIVPSGIATDDTTKFFFQDLMQSRSLISLYDFENRKNIFPGVGHGRFKFSLITLTNPLHPVAQDTDFVFFACDVEDIAEKNRHFELSKEVLALLNPNTLTCPIFRSKRDLELTKAIYERFPILVRDDPYNKSNPWGVKLTMMFQMSSDSHLFRSLEQLEAEGGLLEGNIFYKGSEAYLPLYEGKMVTHFDHRFGSYDAPKQDLADNGKLPELTEQQHANPFTFPIPRYWLHSSYMPDIVYDGRKALLVFRDIVRSTDIHTAIFCIIPNVACGHPLPIVVLDPNMNRQLTYLASCTSSFVFDYVARQKLGGTHMTFSVLKQLPVIPPDQYAGLCNWDDKVSLVDWIWPRTLELTYTAWDLEPFAKDCGYDGPPFRWNEERRFVLRCELDAAYFHLYGIERDDVDYIMETFPIVKRKDEKRYGEYRTKRVILEIYDEMKQAMGTGEPYRMRLEPGPADPSVAHAPRERVDLHL